MQKRRFLLVYVLPVVALIVLVTAPLITGGRTLYLRDVHQIHLPMKHVQAEAFRDGRLPWIDLTRGGGEAVLGNPNAVPFYPTNLLYLVASTFWAFNAHFWIHWLAALAAAFWLGRVWGLGRGGAWVGAATYALSGWFISHLTFYNLIAGAALAPALVAALLTGARPGRPSRGSLVAITGVWALLLVSGDPLMAVLALAAGGLALLMRHRGRLPNWGPLLLAGVCGTLLALPQLVEFRRILAVSFRGYYGYDADVRTATSFDPRQAIGWFFPYFFGLPNTIGFGRFWGHRFFTDWQPYFFSLAPGMVPMMLAAAAGLPWRRKSDRARRRDPRRKVGGLGSARAWGWALAAVGMFFALGRFNPLVNLLLELPGADALRFPIKLWLWVSLGLSVVCGVGFEALRHPAARRRALWAAGLLAVGYTIALASLTLLPGVVESWQRGILPALYPPEFLAFERDRWAAAGGIALAVLAVFALVVALRRRRPALAAALLLFAHTASQLQIHSHTYQQEVTGPYRQPPPLATSGLLPESSRIVHHDELLGRADLAAGNYPSDSALWLMRRTYGGMYPWAGALWNRRYEFNVSPEGLGSFLTVAAGQMSHNLVTDEGARVRLFESWGIDRLLTAHPLAPDSGARLLQAGEVLENPVLVYELPSAAAPVAFVGRVERAADVISAAKRLAEPGFDPRRAVVLPGDTPSARGEAAEPGAAGTARLVEDSPDRLVIDVRADVPGALVVQRSHLPLYRGWVDGRPADVEPANLYRMAVALAPGSHRVEIAIDKRPFHRSLWGAAGGIAGLLLLLFVPADNMRRRHGTRAQDPP